MNDKKIVLADYISWTDSKGVPIGHALKALQEYAEWIEKTFDVVFATHDTYFQGLPNEYKKIRLPYHIHAGECYTSFLGKMKQLWISWWNIRKVFHTKEYKYIWFTNIDIFLFFYLYFHRKQREVVVITIYLDDFPRRYQKMIAQKVLGDIKLLIHSNKDNCYRGTNRMYIPDYLYNGNKYNKYNGNIKKREVICVGNMGPQKELEALVETFSINGIPLKIIGKFSNNEQFEQLKKRVTPNIVIEDRYLNYEQYLELLGEVQYCILPYREDAYSDKTSGVILESIFLDTVPITRAELLKRWDISGISYERIEELQTVKLDDADRERIIQDNRRHIKSVYSKETYLEQLIEVLNE